MADEVELADVIDHTGFQRKPAFLFLMLFRSAGRIVTKTTLLDMLDFQIPSRDASEMALRNTAKYLKLQSRGFPFRVVASYGLGYRLELTDANWHWRDAKRN
ncbi:helix-turn-helix domain-containing protein [Cypionkella sp.]|uniref:helix-turn-helix domain-containing protein n=1 Tax=Cypionkella sp. TaxID=2811411 RepID=UPI002614321E|nr:helix-turn-helix domain-containing protein [Cypionkella sp.]